MSSGKKLVYLADDLDDLEITDRELENNGVPRDHIHVLSEDDAGVVRHDLPAVNEFEKRDFVHAGSIGAAVGTVAALVVLAVAQGAGLVAQVGWTPFVFLSIVLFGFCTWEGGLYGSMHVNKRFQNLTDAMKRGMHVLIVDVGAREEELRAHEVLRRHPAVIPVSALPNR